MFLTAWWVAPFVSYASAQVLGVNINGLPLCAQGCLTNNTGSAIGCAISDIKCICSSIAYVNALSCCLESKCNATEQKTALNFDIDLCNTYNVSIPDFLGCSPLSSTFSYQSGLTSTTSSGASSASIVSSPTSLVVSTLSNVEPAVTTEGGGPIATFTGSPLLTGTCTNPQIAIYTASNGDVLEYPWVGCSGNAPGCCPFNIMEVGPLSVCPSDYYTTSGACCPSGWSVYTTTIGGQVPCYTTPSLPLVVISPTTTNGNGLTTSAIATQLFTLRYVLAPRKRGLSAGATAGVAIGSTAAFALFVTLISLIVRSKRRSVTRQQRQQQANPSSSIRPIPLNILPHGSPTTDQKMFTLAGGTHVNTYPVRASELPSPLPQSPHSPKGMSDLPDIPGMGVARPMSGVDGVAGMGGKTSENTSPVEGRAELAWQPTELPGSTFLHEHHPAFEGQQPPQQMQQGHEQKQPQEHQEQGLGQHLHDQGQGQGQGQQQQQEDERGNEPKEEEGYVQPEDAYSW